MMPKVMTVQGPPSNSVFSTYTHFQAKYFNTKCKHLFFILFLAKIIQPESSYCEKTIKKQIKATLMSSIWQS